MSDNPKRVGCFRWLALPALLFAFMQAWAAVTAFRTPPALAEQVTLSLFLLGLLGLFWAVLFSVAGVMIWQRRPAAFAFIAVLVSGYLAANSLRAILFAQSDYARGRLPFLVITSIIIAIIPLAFLAWRGQHDGDE